jgi:DNA-binding MarR family transcriptional regulator
MAGGGRGGYLLGRVAKAMSREFESLMKEHGLGDIGSGEGRVIYLLWSSGPSRQGELAEKAGVDKSTMALTLSRMEGKGMVARAHDGTDGRGVLVALSAAAAVRAPAFEAVSASMNERFYRGFSEPEINAFEWTLERVLGNLE